jgi:hypothetical protein
MSISHHPILEASLANIPADFKTRIIKYFLELRTRYHRCFTDSDYDAAGIIAGKFCEVIIRFLQNELTGTYTKFGEKLSNLEAEADKLGKTAKTTGNDSLRLLVPKAIVLIYSIRNKRGIGHVGGDVDANEIDSATIIQLANWVICELIRIYHKLSLEEAQDVIDTAVTRHIPFIWNIGGVKRVLVNDISYKDKLLLFLYATPHIGVAIEDAFDSLEHSKFSSFKQTVVKPLHASRLIEWSPDTDYLHLSPTGIHYVEKKIFSKLPKDFLS